MILRKVTRTALSITLGQHYIRSNLTLTENRYNSTEESKSLITLLDQIHAMMPQSAGYFSVQASLC